MGLFGLFKRSVLKPTVPLAPAGTKPVLGSITASTAPLAPGSPEQSAKVSEGRLKFKEGKSYLALIGQIFDVWGIADVIGETRSHIAVKDLPAAIVKRTGAPTIDEIVAIDRKLVLADTKGFHDLPREEAFRLLDELGETLMSYVKDAAEGPLASLDYGDDPKVIQEELRDAKKWARDLWRDELKEFSDITLPTFAANYWEDKRDEAQWTAATAEEKRLHASAKIRKTQDSVSLPLKSSNEDFK